MVLHTGMVQSFQKAFEWRKFLVRRLLGKSEKAPAVCERTCECLHSLGLLLEDHSCRGAATPELQGCDSHLLAVGAYMTGMRQIDANTTIITWLQDHVQVQLLERPLMSVKLSGTYAGQARFCFRGLQHAFSGRSASALQCLLSKLQWLHAVLLKATLSMQSGACKRDLIPCTFADG